MKFDQGWLIVVHEVEHVNGRRRYFHRFIWMDSANTLRRLSRRFYLRQVGYEFVAGMAWHPDGERLVISFSINDQEQFLAVVNVDDVRRVLLEIAQHEQASQETIVEGRILLETMKQVKGIIADLVNDGKRVYFVVSDPNDEIMRHHCAGQFYETQELEMISRSYTNGGVFVDIGANVGNHTIFISSAKDSPKIIVFEPNPAAISILKANLFLNKCQNVDTRYLGIALAAREGRFKGATPYSNNLGHTEYREDAAGDVRAIDGDSLLLEEPIELIKIGVEGMEVDVLLGLERTIGRWRPNIFIEVLDGRRGPFFKWCERQSYRVVEQFQRYPGIQNYLIKPISDPILR